MKSQEILNQEELDQQIPTIKAVFESVYNGKTKQVSYSDTYNSVYKLCKKGMAQEILKGLNNVSVAHFQRIIEKVDIEKYEIGDYIGLINEINQAIETITEILLYIESNYINDPKRQYNSIKNMLSSKFFEELCKNKEVLTKISQKIVQARVLSKSKQAEPLISAINALDEKQILYPQYLMPIYIQKVSQKYKNLFLKNYETMPIKDFLFSTGKSIREERQWLQKHFQRVKGKKLVQQSIKKVYEESLDELKERIYKEKSQQLFKTNVLDFLELLNQKKQQKQLNNYNQWYINEIKKKLSAIDRSNNEKFLKNFIKQYLSISESLADVKNYNISYKATFFLQHWINEQKINLPKRLNVYFEELISKDSDNKEDITNFTILFKFLKEKDYFEKEFRRICAMRMIYNRNKSNSHLQNVMVEQMSIECGADWANKLKQLKTATQQADEITTNLVPSPSFSALVFEDTCWPFLKTNTILPKELLDLAGDYKQKYEQKWKGRLLKWFPLQGFVILNIKFNNFSQQFKMDTVMATILLNLQTFNFNSTIEKVLGRTNLALIDADQQLQLLQKQGILKIQGSVRNTQAKDIPIELNLDYKPSKQEQIIDFTQHYLEQEFIEKTGHEELKAQRKMMVEAFIIKIIKANKTLRLSELYEQITPMIEARGFKFNEKFIENAFNGLIDKRYIKDMQDGTYIYLAS